MPTDNPKISGYVPQRIYDQFKDFQERQHRLSMSQTLTVILAEYFGLKDTIKEITEGTTIGGVTLAEFEQFKQRIEQLEKQVEQNKTTSSLLEKEPLKAKIPELKLIEPSVNEKFQIESLKGSILATRLGVSRSTLSGYKTKHTEEEFTDWARKKDPDGIAWIPVGKKYELRDSLPSELLSNLQSWIDQNK